MAVPVSLGHERSEEDSTFELTTITGSDVHKTKVTSTSKCWNVKVTVRVSCGTRFKFGLIFV